MENPFQKIFDELKKIDQKVSSLDGDVKSITKITNTMQKDEVLDFVGFCKFLKISAPTGYKYTSHNIVPYFKREGRLYFIKSVLMQWVKEGYIKSKSELKQEASEFIEKQKERRAI